jgi:type I restriction enzyme S subunit
MEQLPNRWRKICVGDACRLVNGRAFKPTDWTPTGLPIVRIQNLNNPNAPFNRFSGAVDSKFRIENGELLFAWSGTPGTSFGAHIWERGSAILNQHIFRVLDYEHAFDKTFLRYAINERLDHLIGEAHGGAGLAHVTKPKFEATELLMPPLNEQRRIVAKLEALQSRSRRAREALDAVPPLLEKLRQSILAAAFRGDLTKDWRAKHPDVEPATELLKRIRLERRKKWEETELAKLMAKGRLPTDDKWKAKYKEPAEIATAVLPSLPEGWCWSSIDQVGDLLLGRRRAADEYVAGKDGRVLRPYLRVANVKEDRLDLNDVLEMPFNEAELSTYRLLPGDIILSEGQSPELVGQSAVFHGGIEDLCIQATVHRFRAFTTGTSSEFAQLVFLSHLHTGVFKRASALTTNIAHLTSERLRPLPFPLPPLAEQREITRRVRRVLEQVNALDAVARRLRARESLLSAAILAKAFRGELVPQDPNDEPADVMLARLQESNGSTNGAAQHVTAKKRMSRRKAQHDEA